MVVAVTRDAVEVERELRALGVELIVVSFVCNDGISRARTVPIDRLVHAATSGIGGSTTFAVFTGLDVISTARGLDVPTGDLRIVPDLAAIVTEGDGWAWAPGDLRDQQGAALDWCPRQFLARVAGQAAACGLTVRMAFEHEWTASAPDGRLAHVGPAYGLEATRAAGPILRSLARRLQALGVPVDQLHPEYSPGQLEVSVGHAEPVAAADRVVLVRDAIRTTTREHGYEASLSPKPSADRLGNGAHVHVSLWRDGANLFAAPGDGAVLGSEAASFVAGILGELDALVAVGCASPVSYLRLGPSRWTGAYGCWGLENREAPLRLVRGSEPAGRGANVELKTVDASGNPYLVAGCLIAAGLDGISRGLALPAEVLVDPATLTQPERDRLGVRPLPGSLAAAAASLRESDVLRRALGDLLHDTLIAVREREASDAAGIDPHELMATYRLRY